MSGYTDISTNLENSRNCLRRIARHDEKQFSKDSIVNVMEKFVKTVNIMDETILVPCRLMDRQVGDATDNIQMPGKNTSTSQQHHHNHMNGGNRKNHTQKSVHEFLNSADLFNLYNTLNSLKNTLLWTRNDDAEDGYTEDEELNNISSSGSSTIGGCASINVITPSSTVTSLSDQDRFIEQTSVVNNTGCSSNCNNDQNNKLLSATSNSVKGHNRRPSTASMASSNSVSNLSDSESEISNENDSGIESEGNCGGSRKGTGKNSNSNVDKATDLARQCRSHLSGLYRCLEQMTEAANYLTARYQSDVGPV